MPERTELRERWRRVLVHPIVVANAIATVAYLAVNALFPREFFDLRAWREGPIEQVSHVVLCVGLLTWGRAIVRLRGRARAIAVAVGVYVAFLLLEEIDWGLIYGVDVGFERLIGLPSFHQAQWKSRYFWQDKLYWIGAILFSYYVVPRLPKISPVTRRLEPVLPRFEDSAAFFVVLGTFFIVDLFVKKTISTWQCVMYALIAYQGFLAAKLR